MTLSDLLKLSKLNSVELVAGAAGAGATVTGAVMLDNPEMVDWMRSGELLLTTGYVFKENPDRQETIIDGLIKNHAAGLAIKTRRYFDEIPPAIIEIAEARDFPILQLPYYMSLSEISEIINRSVFLSEYDPQPNGNISQALFELIQQNGSVKDVLDRCEEYVKGSLAFLNLHMKPACVSVRFDSGKERAQEHGGQRLGELFSSQEAENYDRLINLHGPVFLDNDERLRGRRALLCPVKSGGELLGYLLCVFYEESPSNEEARSLCAKISLALSLIMLKERTFMSFKTRETEKFLDSLLTEGEMSHSDIVKSANYCNIAIDQPYVCCVISFSEQFELNETREWVGIKALSRQKLSEGWSSITGGTCRILVKHNNIVLLLSSGEERQAHEQVAAALEYCRELRSRLIDPNCSEAIYIGIGEPAASLSQVYRSYSQALRVVDLMPKLQEENVGCYRRYILYELLYDSPFAKLALTERLKPLLDYDRKHGTELVRTLDAYFKHCRNSVSASGELFIHRNTLLYRLDQISKILDLDFNNNEQTLIIQLALKALIMLK